MVTSFKRSHACTTIFTAPNPASGYHWPTPLLEIPGHSQARLGQSLVESLLLSPGSWCTQGSVCALQESIFQSCVSSGSSMVGLMVTSSKRAYAIPKSAAPRAPVHCWPVPYLHRGCSNTVLSQSLWGPWVLVHTRFVWVLWAFMVGMGFDSKHEFTPPAILLGLLYPNIYLNGTEVPPHAIHSGQVSSFTPQDSSVTEAPWVPATDAQDHGDRVWVTSAGKCQDGMRSHPLPSLRTRSRLPFRRWASISPGLEKWSYTPPIVVPQYSVTYPSGWGR